MKKIALLLSCLSLVVASVAAAAESLEPCINGGVSATGNYPSQELEDAQRYALEPCMNGAVSATGSYPDQSMEDSMKNLLGLSKK
jgi:hypothetical protein